MNSRHQMLGLTLDGDGDSLIIQNANKSYFVSNTKKSHAPTLWLCSCDGTRGALLDTDTPIEWSSNVRWSRTDAAGPLNGGAGVQHAPQYDLLAFCIIRGGIRWATNEEIIRSPLIYQRRRSVTLTAGDDLAVRLRLWGWTGPRIRCLSFGSRESAKVN